MIGGNSFKEPPKWLYQHKLDHPGDLLIGTSGTGERFMALSFNEDGTKFFGQAAHKDPLSNQGAIYEAKLIDGTWQATSIITASTADGGAADRLGLDGIATHGDYLFASAIWDTEAKGYSSGALFVFHSSSAGWVQVEKLFASEPRVSDFFGSDPRLSADGSVLICSARTGENPNVGAQNTGVIHVFHSSSAGWQEVEQISGPVADGQMQNARISADGTKIVAASNISNSVYVFESGSTGFSLVQTLTPSDAGSGGKLGREVELSPNADFIVSSNYQDSELGTDAGSVYVFQSGSGGFTELQKILPITDKTKAGGRFGHMLDYKEKVTGASRKRSFVVSAWLMPGRPGFQYLYNDALGRFEQHQEFEPPFFGSTGLYGLSIDPNHEWLADGDSFYDSQDGTLKFWKWSDEY
jgi:hypothetical protein